MSIQDLPSGMGAPHSLEAEQALLGAMLLDAAAVPVAAQILNASAFYRTSHRLLFTLLSEMHAVHGSVDPVLIRDELARHGLSEEVGGEAVMADLMGAVGSPSQAEHYARIVKEKAVLRGLIEGMRQGLADAQGGGKSEEIIRRLQDRVSGLEGLTNQSVGGFPAIFAQPLSAILNAQDVPIDYLAQSFLERGAIGFIGGEPKLGKSWLALYIALCIATGTPIFGIYAVPQRERVLYIQEEDAIGLLKRRIRLLCAWLAIPEPEDAFFRVAVRTGFKIDDPRWFKVLHKELMGFHPALVVVDVFNKVHTAEERDQQEMTRIMGLFESLRREFACAIQLVHHFKKEGSEGSKRGNQRLRGSSVLGSCSECSFYLSQMQDGSLRVEHESKNPTLEPFAFRLEDVKDPAGGLIGVRLAYQGAAAVIQQSDKLNEMLGTVQKAYTEGGEGLCTAKALAERANVSENTVRAQLRLLEDAGKVRQVKIRPGGQGRSVTAYPPAEAADPAGEDGSATHPPRGDELMKQAGDPQEVGSSAQKPPFELIQEAGEGVARG